MKFTSFINAIARLKGNNTDMKTFSGAIVETGTKDDPQLKVLAFKDLVKIYSIQFPGEEIVYKIVYGNNQRQKHETIQKREFELIREYIQQGHFVYEKTTSHKTRVERNIWTPCK